MVMEAKKVRGLRQSTNPPDDRLDLVIAARLSRELGISVVTFWRWRHADGFPAGRRINRRVYFSRREVVVWLNRQAVA
jgi:predicted DNA-binding transcriptional regulator AlpA